MGLSYLFSVNSSGCRKIDYFVHLENNRLLVFLQAVNFCVSSWNRYWYPQ